MVAAGRVVRNRGENNPNSKLNIDKVIQINNYYTTGEYNQHQLANMFGVSQHTIWCVVSGATWKNYDSVEYKLPRGSSRRWVSKTGGALRKPMVERFWNKVIRDSQDECWIWNAYVDNGGYGVFNMDSKHGRMKAHRVSWIIHNGEIPDGMYVCHKCDNRRCVNPGHLFLGTALDNTKDRMAKGRRSGPRKRHG